MESIFPAVLEILGSKRIDVTMFDHSGLRDVINHHRSLEPPFPIGGPLTVSVFFANFLSGPV